MKLVTSAAAESEIVKRLLNALNGDGRVEIENITNPVGCLIAAILVKKLQTFVLLVTSGPRQAEKALDDAVSFAGSEFVGFLPPRRQHPFKTSPLAPGPHNERVEALLRLGLGRPAILVTQPEALIDDNPDLCWIREHTVSILQGETLDRNTFLRQIVEADYHRETLVDAQGQYAVRGGLIDLFPFGHEAPIRMEFDEDEIASLRVFDPADQRSTKTVTRFKFLLGDSNNGQKSSLFDMLPDEALVFYLDRHEISQRIDSFNKGVRELPNNASKNALSVETQRSVDEILDVPSRLKLISWRRLEKSRSGCIDFGSRRTEPFHSGFAGLKAYFSKIQSSGLRVVLGADASGEQERLREQLLESGVEGVRTLMPSLSEGFVSTRLNLAFMTSHELFSRRRMRARHTRFRRRIVQFDRSELRRNDLVVHNNYGIGIYEGLVRIKVRNQPTEALKIRYKGDVVLYVKLEHFGMVEKYTGAEAVKPKLSRIGTGEWSRVKKRTRKALKDMTEELTKLYARRKVLKGIAFSSDTHWQSEMEASFEFEDTPDQAVANTDVKADLEAGYPMDRLLCGDVGFGKTEVAIRAAFKVVQESYQVAILVPTTILAQQHDETFKSRLAQYPVRIEVLSRFKTKQEQREIVTGLHDGSVDIIIGTHRLLSKDVGFKRLGLVIIDEEHRFGVRHKERLKQLKTNVDVLTLTATPIPRTLQLAMTGVRDTSQINTPPVDRLPVQTEITSFSESLIRDAIYHEVDRQGQVFFVHNRVQSIYSALSMLERLAPGLRYAVGHGQMPEKELENVMLKFMHGEYDVLVSTMIIESGLDIPNVNTMIVNRADRFGLAQLYQLRGRIGRSNRQAYAYLMTPPKLSITPEAKRRLSTLSELTELGSGMKVAMRDLEIRGAGNLLGAEQSGFINAVGFEMYSKLLEEAVQDLSDEEMESSQEDLDVKVEFDGPAFISSGYIEDSDLRFEFYRRLSSAQERDIIERIAEEFEDRFGKMPVEVGNLCQIIRLKLLGRSLNFSRISITNSKLTADLNLSSDPEMSQNYIGKLVAAADPYEVEFRLTAPVAMVHSFKSENELAYVLKFLQKLEKYNILTD